jgi:hypothetical protein
LIVVVEEGDPTAAREGCAGIDGRGLTAARRALGDAQAGIWDCGEGLGRFGIGSVDYYDYFDVGERLIEGGADGVSYQMRAAAGGDYGGDYWDRRHLRR